MAVHTCTKDGCDRREWKRDEFLGKGPFLCSRHLLPERVLSQENRERTGVLTAASYPSGNGMFWMKADGLASTGYESGPDWNAYADDFPPGTRLIITARIELPEEGDAA